MDAFLSIVQGSGIHGLIIGFLVLVSVFALNKSGVVFTGGQKQLANVVLSLLLSGVNLLDPSFNSVIVATIASLGSALAYEGIRWLASK